MNSTVGVNRAIKTELLIVVGLELALVVGLHLMGGPAHSIPAGAVGEWFATTDATTALVAVARLAGLVIAYWLLASTVLYAVAHRLGWTELVDLLRWVTLPVIRRTVHGVTAMSLTSASILGPAVMTATPALATDEEVTLGSEAVAADPGQQQAVDLGYRPGAAGVPEAITDGVISDDGAFWRPVLPAPGLVAASDEETPGDDYEPGAAGWPERPGDGAFWRPDAPADSGSGSAGGRPGSPAQDQPRSGSDVRSQAATTYVVEPTDHFWKIAEQHLRDAVGRSVTEDEVAQYWVRVVEANRDTIRSGDPDLIFPGEQITLPEVYSE